MSRSRNLVAVLLLTRILPASLSSAADCGASLSAEDAPAVRAVQEAYRTAWLRGDEKGVLATFTDDAVLIMPRSRAQDVRAVVDELTRRGGPV